MCKGVTVAPSTTTAAQFGHKVETWRSCGHCNSALVVRKMARRRSCAAEFPNGDAEPFRLVGEVVLDSRAGKCMTPIGSSSSMASLRLKGAALACFVQSGLKAICGTFRVVAHLEAISSAPLASRRG